MNARQEFSLQLYHTGLIVNDLESAMTDMGEALRMQWAPPRDSTKPMLFPDGTTKRHVRYTYSLQGPHFIELIEQVDPSPFLGLTGGRYTHHLGYYTDDLDAASAALERRGYRCELSGVRDGEAITLATYHYNPESPGVWIELVAQDTAVEVGDWIGEAAAAAGVKYLSPFA